MAPDIRSFFTLKPNGTAPAAAAKKTQTALEAKPSRQAKPQKNATKDALDSDATSPEHFEAPKPKRVVSSVATSRKPATKPAKASSTVKKSNGTISRRPVVSDDDDAHVDDFDGGDDLFTAEFKNTKRKDDYQSGSEPEGASVPVPTRRSTTTKAKSKPIPESESSSEEELEVVKPKATRTRAPTKPAASRVRKTTKDEPEDGQVAAILDSIPQVRPPTPPLSDGQAPKFNYAAVAGRTAAASGDSSSVELPTGEENCLVGLTFVFTGTLKTLERGAAQNLVKRYGGKVTGTPSGKTSFVVLGDDAGPKKLETIRKHGTRTIDEEGLFELIRKLPAHGGNGKEAAKHREKQKEAEAQIRQQAAEMDREEERRQKEEAAQAKKAQRSGTGAPARPITKPSVSATSKLWTVKYAPSQLGQICGNKGAVEKLQRWLKGFDSAQKSGFKKGGPDGSGFYRAVMIHGPPGIGKTTAAHLVAKLEGYDVVESNASDTRSKKLVEEGLRGVLSSKSLVGYFSADGKSTDKQKQKMVLVMDEVDGMSAGDRGGVGALAAVCKKTNIPVILICNERRLPKMKPFDHVTFDLPFRRPTADQIRSRISTIAFREGMKVPPPVIDALIEGSGADIRQVVNMLSAAKLDMQVMSKEGGAQSGVLEFDQGKQMAKSWEKHVMLKPWDLAGKILGGGMFAESSTATLNDKAELYFNDHEFAPLMIQENYLSTMPSRATQQTNPGRMRNLKALEMTALAAESISDGDLVDRMIHGPQQNWILMPVHAMFSFVRPASFIFGPMRPGRRIDFTRWLGNNSSQLKRERLLKEMQARIRLAGGGNRDEIRLQYVPALWRATVERLGQEGKDGIDQVIEVMDGYYLTRDDFDSLLEIGIGRMGSSAEQGAVQIDKTVKTAFTRTYNQRSHPVAYYKADPLSSKALAAPKPDQPDLEEAVQEESDGDTPPDEDGSQDGSQPASLDFSKDKMIKQAKKPAAKKQAGTATKRKKADVDDDSPAKKPAKRVARAKK